MTRVRRDERLREIRGEKAINLGKKWARCRKKTGLRGVIKNRVKGSVQSFISIKPVNIVMKKTCLNAEIVMVKGKRFTFFNKMSGATIGRCRVGNR